MNKTNFCGKNKGENKNNKNVQIDTERRRYMDALALILIIVGAINWGSVGIFGFDIVGWLFGGQLSVISRIIFTVVGLGGLWAISFFFKEKIMNKREVN